jgi:RNA-directed DNA polymerase
MDINQVPIKRHVKIRAEATPYDPRYIMYLENRAQQPQTRNNIVR